MANSLKFVRYNDRSQKNPHLSLTYVKKDTYNVFNERTNRNLGTFHTSRLKPTFSKRQLDFVKKHGTTNFVETKKVVWG